MRTSTVAVLAVAVMLGVAACDGAVRESSTPTQSAGSSQPTAVDLDMSSVPGRRLALAALPTGAPPGVPWIEAGTLHVGDRALVLPEVRTRFPQYARRVVPYGFGALLELSDYSTSVIVTVDASGRVVRRGPGAALVSGPAGRVAWWDGRTGEVVVADSSGRELRRETGPALGAGDGLTAVGWLDERDVVLRVGYSGGGYLWSTSGEDLQWWRGEAFAISPVGGLVAAGFWGGTGPDNECTLVGELGPWRRPLWRHCFWRGDLAYWSGDAGTFSPDGRLLLVTGGSQTNGARPFHALLDARTGEPLARFDHGRYGDDRVGAMYQVHGFAFEDDEHVLMVVADRTGRGRTGSQVAIVRCDVATTCELATEPRPYRWRDEGEQRPYELAY